MAAKKDNEKIIRVADWMTPSVLAVETFESIGLARRLMAKHRVNQLPVLENDRLVGIVTDRDVRDAYPTSLMINRPVAIDRFADKVTVEEVMTHDVLVVGPETALMTAVGLLRRHRIGSLPVVSDQKLVGIITRSDILDFVLRGGVRRAHKAGKAPAPTRKAGATKRIAKAKTRI